MALELTLLPPSPQTKPKGQILKGQIARTILIWCSFFLTDRYGNGWRGTEVSVREEDETTGTIRLTKTKKGEREQLSITQVGDVATRCPGEGLADLGRWFGLATN